MLQCRARVDKLGDSPYTAPLTALGNLLPVHEV